MPKGWLLNHQEGDMEQEGQIGAVYDLSKSGR